MWIEQRKKLEKNTLAKVLNRPGISEKAIGQALTKYSNSIDDTFVEVLEQDITHISDHDIGVVAEIIYSSGYDTVACVATIAILRRAKLKGMFNTQGDED